MWRCLRWGLLAESSSDIFIFPFHVCLVSPLSVFVSYRNPMFLSLFSILLFVSLLTYFFPITCPIPSSLPFHYHRLFWHFLLALFSLMVMGILYAALLSIIKVEIWYCSSGQIQKHFNIILISVDSNYSTSLWGTLWNVILNTFKRYAICHSG